MGSLIECDRIPSAKLNQQPEFARDAIAVILLNLKFFPQFPGIL
jgi:hypothetical protein